MPKSRNSIANGYDIHDITILSASYGGNRNDYVEITDQQLKQKTITKYCLFREIATTLAAGAADLSVADASTVAASADHKAVDHIIVTI